MWLVYEQTEALASDGHFVFVFGVCSHHKHPKKRIRLMPQSYFFHEHCLPHNFFVNIASVISFHGHRTQSYKALFYLI